MSKGSGRRRISPSDGLQYDEDTMMTNIEQRGGAHYQSGSKEMRLGLRTGAQSTNQNYGRRWAGKGRKDDHRNWKSHGKGKQYEHNAVAQEKSEHYRPVPESLASRLRQRSIAVLLHEARRRAESSARYRRQREKWYSYQPTPYHYPPQSEQKYRIGYAVLEAKVKSIELNLRYGFR